MLWGNTAILFPRATSQTDMLACTFGDCREVFDLLYTELADQAVQSLCLVR